VPVGRFTLKQCAGRVVAQIHVLTCRHIGRAGTWTAAAAPRASRRHGCCQDPFDCASGVSSAEPPWTAYDHGVRHVKGARSETQRVMMVRCLKNTHAPYLAAELFT
jgi:hypothetical protein